MERTEIFGRLGRRGRGSWARVAGIATVVLAIMLGSAAVAAEDGECRGQVTVTTRVGSATLSVGFEARSAGEFGDVYYRTPVVSVGRSVGEHVVIAASYARVEKKGGTGWKVEQRPYGEVTLRWKSLGLDLSDRNRVELRIRDDRGAVRYRNRLRVRRDLGPAELRAHIDEEVFVDVEDADVSKNRVTVGVDARVAGGARAGVFYLFESSKGSDGWASVHGIGAQVTCSL